MKKKKAFTLIELLAVITIISVILMIAVPIINNIVSESRKSAFLESVRSMMRIVENDPDNPYFSVRSYSLTKGDLKNNENNYKLEYKNPVDANGYFYTNNQGNLFLKVSNDKWCVVKDYSDEQPYFHNDCSKFDTDDPTYSKWMTEEELNEAGYTTDDPEVERKAEYGYYDVESWNTIYILTKPEYYKEKTMYNVKYYSWQVVFNGIIQYDWWRGYTSCGPSSLPTCAGAPTGSSYFSSVPTWSCVGIDCTGTALVGDDREILTFTRMYWDRSWSSITSSDSGWCNHVTGSGSTPCYKHSGHSSNSRLNSWDVTRHLSKKVRGETGLKETSTAPDGTIIESTTTTQVYYEPKTWTQLQGHRPEGAYEKTPSRKPYELILYRYKIRVK